MYVRSSLAIGLLTFFLLWTVDEYFGEAAEYLGQRELESLVSHTAGFAACHILKWYHDHLHFELSQRQYGFAQLGK